MAFLVVLKILLVATFYKLKNSEAAICNWLTPAELTHATAITNGDLTSQF